ncbi:uncharacterized protein LOC133850482 [Drosophila sulfurigaster albostrigata]|uniref:uncharacterized protein LOC133850482 n=1 Tax=Drosophila sulfurigaster albostrigata TaxID=89887 RepID=UPI002D21CEB6|nr:uncharacterized protein LOC133850482 [Drosophila sulfurigaster albostrigata]
MPEPSPLRQRDELRRSKSPSGGAEEASRGRGERSSRLRIKKRMRICVHTAEGSSLLRTMGGRCEVCKAPTPTDGGQRPAHGRGAADSGRGGRGGAQLPSARSRKQRPQRRRGTNPRASTGGRSTGGTGSIADPGPGGSELLKAMASCLVAQASVLAAMVPGVCAGPAGTDQVGPVAAKSANRRAADSVDSGSSRGGDPHEMPSSQIDNHHQFLSDNKPLPRPEPMDVDSSV